jgi:hypothetical protein
MHAYGPTEPLNRRLDPWVLPDLARPSVRGQPSEGTRSFRADDQSPQRARYLTMASPERMAFLYIQYDRHKRVWSCEETSKQPKRRARRTERGTRIARFDQYASALTTSPPARVPRAWYVGCAIVCLINRTDPSTIAKFAPPGCKLPNELIRGVS